MRRDREWPSGSRRLARTTAIAAAALALTACGSSEARSPAAVSDAVPAPSSIVHDAPPTVGSTSASVPVTTVDRPVPPPTASTAPAAPPAESAGPAGSAAPAAPPTDAGATVGPCGRTAPTSVRYDHVVWVWMENKNTAAITDPAAAPYLASIAARCASATDFVDHGLHPSLPNYIAATSGDPQGVSDDGPPSAHPLLVDNIFRQVRGTGQRAASYEESMTGTCGLEATHLYAVKHNPAAYFADPADRAACQRDNVPFDELERDLAARDLPAFSLITPNICNDMHDCPVATGDQWLEHAVGALTSSTVYAEGRTIIFITFDESEGAGTMPFFAIAPGIRAGTRSSVELDHYALLAFTEDALGITSHLGHGVNAPDLAAALGLPRA